jgi:IS30 family transposase
MAQKTSVSASKSRRLSSEERAEIIRLNAEGNPKKVICEMLQVSPPTVARTLADAQNGSATTVQSRRVATPPIDVDLAKRLKALAVAVVMDESVDQDEKLAMKTIIEQRIVDAQSRAAQEALASL